MENTNQTITTAEYSKQTGLSVPTITRMLRQGKLPGEKQKGKWAIPLSELETTPAVNTTKDEQTAKTGSPTSPPPKTKSLTIAEFAQRTYLTEQGVQRWLKNGRLTGSITASGEGLVDSDNLSRPEISHLIR